MIRRRPGQLPGSRAGLTTSTSVPPVSSVVTFSVRVPILDTVPAVLFATHTAPPAGAMPSGLAPTETVLVLPVAAAILVTVPSDQLVTRAAPAANVTSYGAAPTG